MHITYEPKPSPKGDYIIIPKTLPLYLVLGSDGLPVEGTDDYEFAIKLAEFIGGTIARGD